MDSARLTSSRTAGAGPDDAAPRPAFATRPVAWVVVPAYNEAIPLPGLIRQLRERQYAVVVVDDGSTDATGPDALRAGAIVLRHAVNLGQGAALQTGISFALSQGAQAIVSFDADGQHDPDDIDLLLSTRLRTGADLVLGSRFLGSAPDMPPARRMLLRAAVRFTRLVHRMPVTDAHNGLRLFSRRAAEQIRITHNRMAHASEITSQIRALGLSYSEAPVTVAYSEYSLSKGQRNGDAVKIVVDLLIGRLFR